MTANRIHCSDLVSSDGKETYVCSFLSRCSPQFEARNARKTESTQTVTPSSTFSCPIILIDRSLSFVVQAHQCSYFVPLFLAVVLVVMRVIDNLFIGLSVSLSLLVAVSLRRRDEGIKQTTHIVRFNVCN